MLRRLWLACAVVAWSPGLAAAQPVALQWRLNPGQTLQLQFQQRTVTEIHYGQAPLQTELNLTMTMRWRVLAAGPERIDLAVAFQRIQVEMDSQAEGKATYDSQAQSFQGDAEALDSVFRPLLQAEIRMALSPKGKVLEVAVPEELRRRLQQAPGARWERLLTPEGLRQALERPLWVLPEHPVAPGGTWEQQETVESPLGNLRLHRRYRLLEPVQEEQARVAMEGTVQLVTQALQEDRKLQEGKQEGSMVFDLEAGRPREILTHQRLVLQSRLRDQVIPVAVDSHLSVQIGPAGQ